MVVLPQTVLHVGVRPIPMPPNVVSVAPAGQQTIDGSQETADLLVCSSEESVHVFSTAPELVVEVIDRAVDPSTHELWVIDRRRLAMALGNSLIALESGVKRLARRRGLTLRGFTGISEGEPRNITVYDEVRNDVSFSARPPSTRA